VSTATAVPTPTPTSQQSLSATPTASLPSSPVVGARAPGLMLPDLAGNWVSLESLEGKPVLLNFWASW
jgi:thiol-disulfide isomerase/thioredoxin